MHKAKHVKWKHPEWSASKMIENDRRRKSSQSRENLNSNFLICCWVIKRSTNTNLRYSWEYQEKQEDLFHKPYFLFLPSIGFPRKYGQSRTTPTLISLTGNSLFMLHLSCVIVWRHRRFPVNEGANVLRGQS